MSKNIHALFLLLLLTVFTGCETVHGMGEDIQNASNPDKNGWDSLVKLDGWMRQNLW